MALIEQARQGYKQQDADEISARMYADCVNLLETQGKRRGPTGLRRAIDLAFTLFYRPFIGMSQADFIDRLVLRKTVITPELPLDVILVSFRAKPSKSDIHVYIDGVQSFLELKRDGDNRILPNDYYKDYAIKAHSAIYSPFGTGYKFPETHRPTFDEANEYAEIIGRLKKQ